MQTHRCFDRYWRLERITDAHNAIGDGRYGDVPTILGRAVDVDAWDPWMYSEGVADELASEAAAIFVDLEAESIDKASERDFVGAHKILDALCLVRDADVDGEVAWVW